MTPAQCSKTKKTKTYYRLRKLMMALVEEVSAKDIPTIMEVVIRWLDTQMMFGCANTATTGGRSLEILTEELQETLNAPLEEMPPLINDNTLQGIIARQRLEVGA